MFLFFIKKNENNIVIGYDVYLVSFNYSMIALTNCVYLNQKTCTFANKINLLFTKITVYNPSKFLHIPHL